jgi:hypothetical protein
MVSHRLADCDLVLYVARKILNARWSYHATSEDPDLLRGVRRLEGGSHCGCKCLGVSDVSWGI